MSKKILSIVSILLMLFTFASCKKNGSITLHVETQMVVGETYKVEYTLNKIDDDAKLTWEISNPSVAELNEKDLTIKALAAGTFTLTVSAGDVEASKEINVKAGEEKPTMYAISYELNGGSATGAVVQYDGTKDVTLPTPTKEGYNFLGWYESADFSGSKVEKIAAGSKGDKTFYAKWEEVAEDAYTISYELNGGKLSGQATSYTGAEDVVLVAPTFAGYEFAGWYESADFSGAKVEKIAAGSTGNKTFYAKWTLVEYTVSYELNGGSMTGAVEAYNVESEDIALVAPTKEGYTFLGWYESADFAGSKVEKIVAGSTGNKTFYAKWESEEVEDDGVYDVKYVIYGGSMVNATYTYDGSVDVAMPTVLRVGYSFKGWYDNAEFTGSKVEKIAAGETGDKTYYAKWQPSVYSIVYNLDGGELENPQTSYTIEDKVTLPTPTRPGHEFLGWFDNAELEGEPVTEIAKGNTGKFEFYAAWEALEVEVVYDFNGGLIPEEELDATIAKFTEEFLADWNAIASSPASKASFRADTSKTIKEVFANAEFLAKYSWLFTYLHTELTARYPDATSEYITDALRDLPLLASGDTTVIEASANTRTLIRVTLEALMNEAAPDAVNYAEFAKYSIDYTVAENQEGFLKAYKGTFKTLTKVVLIGSEVLAAPTKVGGEFLGWFDENGEQVEVIEKACTLTAKWIVKVAPTDDLVAVLNAANAGETIMLEAGDYDLSGYAFTKDVTILGPNADVDGAAERAAEANVKMSSATLSANLTIKGLNITGTSAWSDKGILLNANAGHLVLENNIISKYLTFIQTNANHSADVESSITIEHNKFNTIGQFFVYIQDGKGAGIAKLEFNYNTTVANDSYGMVGVNGMLSLRDVNTPDFVANVVGNYFDSVNTEDYDVAMIRINSGKANVIGNTFNNINTIVSTTSTSTIIFKYNMFLGADGKALETAPAGVSDPNVSTTDEERLAGIEAYFTPLPKYTIEYDLDGGEWDAEEGVLEFEEGTVVTLPTPVKAGYKFLGWVDAEGNPVTEITNQNYSLVATWEVIEYTITLNLNGGVLAETTIKYTVEDVVVLPTPTKDGLTFAGWFDNEGLTGTSIKEFNKATGDKDLYACWTEVKYSVKYVLDGGSYEPTATEALPGQKIELGKATKEGYTFLGWKLFANAEEFVWDVTCQEADITLYAVFGNEGIYVGEKYDYATLDAALAVAEEGDTIILMPGTYTGGKVEKSVTIQAYNWLKTSINQNVALDSIVTGDITIAADDVTIKGVVLTGKGRIATVSTQSIEDLTIKYVVVRSSTLNVGNVSVNAPFYLVSGEGYEVINATIANCRIENDPSISTDRAMIAILSNVNGITIKDNEFTGRRNSNYNDGIKVLRASDEALDKSSFGIKGDVTITGNTFSNYEQYVIWFREYGAGNYVIENNVFNNIGATDGSHAAVNFITSHVGTGKLTISVKYNVINSGFMLFRIDGAVSNGSIEANYNVLQPVASATKYVKDLSGLTSNYDNNYWGVAAPASTAFNGISAPSKVYASADEVPSIGEVEEAEYKITYELGDGDWDKDYYTYDEIIADLLADLSAYYGKTVSASDVHDISEVASVTMFDFFLTHSTYSAKWGWLADFFIETRGKDDDRSGDVSYLNDKNNAYWRYEVWAFLNKATRTSWPYSSEYDNRDVQAALDQVALQFAVSQPGPETYVPGGNTPLIGAVCEGRVFLYWVTQDDVILTDNIPFNMTGDLTLTAVFLDEVKATSFKVTNIPSKGIERYDTLQLEWSFNPVDTYNTALLFESTDTNIFTVSKTGLITAVDTGTATLKVTVLGNEELNCEYTINVYVPGQFELSYKTESYVKAGDSIELVARYVGGSSSALTWTSADEAIATVDDSGVVTGVKAGTTTIKVALADNAEEYAEFTVTVLDSELSDVLQFIVDSHESNVFERYDLNIGGTYKADILGSVNEILFNEAFAPNTKYLEQGNAKYAGQDRTMTPEFITVHYTGNMAKGANAAANAGYFVQPVSENSTSIHYTTGNDGVFHCMDVTTRAAHAGDTSSSDSVGAFAWLSTGVAAPANVTPYDLLAIEVTVSDDCHYVINGQKTSIPLPPTYVYSGRKSNHTYNNKGQIVNAEDGSVRDAETYFNDMGFRFIVENGEYKMAKTWWCYTQVWEGRICTCGGNSNAIGIESCVNEGSDLWYTWQLTAQLVAHLMQDNNLDINRVVGHHFHSAKNCPQPMLENDMEIWNEFFQLVEAEYELLTKYSDYTISFEVLSGEDVLADNGRVSFGKEASIVTYKVTVTKGGNSESIILASAVPGSFLK